MCARKCAFDLPAGGTFLTMCVMGEKVVVSHLLMHRGHYNDISTVSTPSFLSNESNDGTVPHQASKYSFLA